MKKQLIKILRLAFIGAGISMILFIGLLLTGKINQVDILKLSIYLLLFGMINGISCILFDYLSPLLFTIIHFILTFLMILFLFISFKVINPNFFFIFYLFEFIFTIYILIIIIFYITNIINGNKINEKLGNENKIQQTFLFLAKVFIVWGSVLFILPDLISSLLAFILIATGTIFLIIKKEKTKYSFYLMIINTISFIINLLLLIICIIIQNSGGSTHIGLFDGLIVTITNIILNLITYSFSIVLMRKSITTK